MQKLFTLLFAVTIVTGAQAQQMNQADAMKAWQAYMTPGDVHKMLAKSDGTWKTETRMWMDPSQPPMTSTGTCTNRMIMGGRYQESDFKGSMMGQPFEGRSTLAYDNAKKLFISTWIDNMGTGMATLEGHWDDATKSITFSGTMVDPSSGKDIPMRQVFTIVDAKHQRMEMYMRDPGGKEFKNMEVLFSKA